MRHIEIVIPFGLPQSGVPPDLLSQREMPALAKLVSRARCEKPSFLPFSDTHALPHEILAAYQEGLISSLATSKNIPAAGSMMNSFGFNPAEGFWFVLHPAHIQVTLDKLLLSDRRQLTLSDAESKALFEKASPCFEERKLMLQYGDAMTWFVRADEWCHLHTSTPDVATGRHIELWLPQGKKAMEWRVLLNEVQMSWHGHDVNLVREKSGLPPVNALWLWGGTDIAIFNGMNHQNAGRTFSSFFSATGPACASAENWFADVMKESREPRDTLLVIDDLSAPALADEWYEWAVVYGTLEQAWFGPLLRFLKEGRLDRLVMHLDNDEKLFSFTMTRSLLRRFWIRPSLKRLFT